MGNVNLTEQLANDSSFISRLNERYPKYNFSVDEYDKKSLLVKKLA